MRASVLIPTYETRGSILPTVYAVLAQDLPRDDFEVFVLENDWLTREDRFVIAQLKGEGRNISLIRQKNAPFTRLYNEAVRRAQGEFLVFCASHCIPARDWLVKWLDFMGKGVFKAAAGPIVSVPSDDRVSQIEAKRNDVLMPRLQRHNRDGFLDYHNAVVRRDFFLRRGALMGSLFSVMAVMEFGARLHRSGTKVGFVEGFAVPHVNEWSFWRYCRSAYIEGVDKTIIYERKGGEYGLRYFPHPTFARHRVVLRRVRLPLYVVISFAQVLCAIAFHAALLVRFTWLQERLMGLSARFAHQRGQLAGFGRVK